LFVYLARGNEQAEHDRAWAEQPPPKRIAGAKPATPAPGSVRVNPKDGLKYVWIPPGTFQMGCLPGDTECFDDEKPAHEVSITKGFWLGQTPVTVAAYKRFVSETPGKMPPAPGFDKGWNNGQMPIVRENWH